MILLIGVGVRHWVLGVIIALIVLGVATTASYVVLDHFCGEKLATTSTQIIIIENSGQQVSIDNVEYAVQGWEYVPDENAYRLTIYPTAAPAVASDVNVVKSAYEQAQDTGNPVTVFNTTTTETKPIDALPIAASIGIAMGVVVFAVWVGYRQMWGDATSTLIEYGLHDMTVRDVEIVGQMMELKEFTIPELMKLTKTSKITVWRTVQKLVKRGLVQPTEQTRLAANGLGGRGKPSNVYKYTGEKKESKT